MIIISVTLLALCGFISQTGGAEIATMSKNLKVLVSSNDYPEAGLEILREHFTVLQSQYLHFGQEGITQNKEELLRLAPGISALVWVSHHPITKELLDKAGPSLKVVATASAGYNHCNVDELKARSIKLSNTPDVLSPAVAEIAIALMLGAGRRFTENLEQVHSCVSTMSSGVDQIDTEEFMKRNLPLGNTPQVLDDAVADIAIGLLIGAARRFKEGVEELESGAWKEGVQWMLGQDIVGSTVGIVGLGGIGQAIVRRMRGFDVKRFVYSGRSDKPGGKALGAERVPLEQLLKESDYVVLCCPLTTETKNLINDQTLSIMKKSAVLVNIGRGGIVHQEALYRALKEKRIFAAGLDVVTPEPMPKDHPLMSLPNCFIVPHLGSATHETRNMMSKIAANNVLSALEGKPMVHRIQL